jgi:hypothetical protein
MNLVEKLNPRREDGGLDGRYTELAKQIIGTISRETISDLNELCHQTNAIQNQFSRSGLRFVIGVFQVEMEDWQRKAFKKQLRSLLQECGFKPSMATKLMAAGEFVASELPLRDYNPDLDAATEELHKQEHDYYLHYLKGYGVSSLYLLSQMDYRGRIEARQHYNETNGHCSTRELEELKQQYPRWSPDRRFGKRQHESSDESSLVDEVGQLTAAVDPSDLSTDEMVNQFVLLAQSINWSAVGTHTDARQLLNSIGPTLNIISGLAHESQYSQSV